MLSATVAQVREVLARARERLGANGQRTILFLDEIHRFNKAQQDALLPGVEEGVITLIGATTENPYFEVNSALLSRAEVYELLPLSLEELETVARRGAAELDAELPDDLVHLIATRAGGDARSVHNIVELALQTAQAAGEPLSEAHVDDAARKRPLLYDKAADAHYDFISAFIKSMRGSDPDAAVYYLVRMLEAGEEPRFLLRRMVIFASEDVGNADPRALQVAVDALRAFELVGLPEGVLPMTQAATFLATCPKSNSVIAAYAKARSAVLERGPLPVPLKLRNAPTPLMKSMGYAGGYRYPHNFEGHYVPEEYLPDELQGSRFYEPSDSGEEARIKERLDALRKQRDGK